MAHGYHNWPLIEFRVIGEAWQLYKRHWFIWSLAMLIVLASYGFVAGGLLTFFGIHDLDDPGGFRLFLKPGKHTMPFLVANAVSSVFLGGMIRMASKQVRGGVPRLEDLISVIDVWFDLVLAALLYGAATSIGYAFCVVPGLIFAGLFMLAIPLVVEGRLPATAALAQSWSALKGQWLNVTLFNVVLIAVSLSGVLLCGLGLPITGPLYCLAISIIYRDFFGSSALAASKKGPEPFPDF